MIKKGNTVAMQFLQRCKNENRIKKIMTALLLFSTCISGAMAQTVIKENTKNKAEPVQISLQVKGDKSAKDSITVIFWKDHIYGDMLNGGTSYTIKPDKNGAFKINLPAIDHPGRISIYDWAYDLSIARLQLVEPGDHIQIAVQTPESDTEEVMLTFSGKGAAKYECNKAITLNPFVDYRALSNTKDYHQSLKSADSLLQKKLNVVDRYKERLSSLAYRIMKADLKGEIYLAMCGVIRPKSSGNRIKEMDPNHEEKLRKAFRELKSRVDTRDEGALILSTNYTRFLYELAKLESVLLDSEKSYEFKNVYHKLRSNYSGKLREKLLVSTLYNSWDQYTEFFGMDTHEYTNCLKDALELTQTPYLKNALKKRLNTRGKGATAFNFTLPADSSGRMVSLSDLKGKVVLVDMWGFNCTGCYMFSQAFHEKVYPQFKDNPDFVVVSMMLDEYAGKDKYMRRLRGEGKYTAPEYTNLYAGKELAMRQLIRDHYNIDAVPFLLLVDKEGKIYSSTLPFFTDTSNSTKIEALTELIKEALAAK